MDRRTDYKTALLIDSAIHEAASEGRPRAATELARMGVPLETTMRVLTRPVERRHQIASLSTVAVELKRQ
ncbi:hypothetical protein [Massilia yuzhufengensis]|uniref:Uncharacterized protein n=1 Tax=Massilia yuzhufengensis TaxID=1164594 RepID=A0A1I1FSB1_9BURK|nr:hypothetical protein [Massilia yuzhufengensis]SFB99880.1 hypothetical protein SAMN05216204_10337 [Massilia yuzhufengensis]